MQEILIFLLLVLLCAELTEVVNENLTGPFILPYRFYTFYKIEDSQTYVLTYVSQLPFVFISGLGQSAADCLMVTLVFHICGQMAVLAIRISKINSDADVCEEELRKIVKDHNRLLE